MVSERTSGKSGNMWMDPAGIEAESMRRIEEALGREEACAGGMKWQEPERSVVRRVIHTTADFDFAGNLFFSQDAVKKGREALAAGKPVITDTNMALAGISRPSCLKFGNAALCFMSDPQIAVRARAEGCTRAYASMGYAAEHFPDAVYAVGNAPTALFRLSEIIQSGTSAPALIIAVPVGFVNVVESKELIRKVCMEKDIPLIAAMGQKGGSPVAAAIVNALFYGIPEI